MQGCIIVWQDEVFTNELCESCAPGKRFPGGRIGGVVDKKGNGGCSERFGSASCVEECVWGDWLVGKGGNAITLGMSACSSIDSRNLFIGADDGATQSPLDN